MPRTSFPSSATARSGCASPPTSARKSIRSSNGQAQTRYVIRTTLALGDRMWPVEFTLACRKSMRYRVLLGSKALIAGQLVVNPALAYVQDRPESPAALPAATSIDLLDGSPV